ncbi:hypothetical protein [uncultured Bradyrhizobium sp.]|uniref:hypothetical protein n=1 Tax=uncultured Bradyrhizobium sp. TaxID=199684 RepID=UPI0035CAAAC3
MLVVDSNDVLTQAIYTELIAAGAEVYQHCRNQQAPAPSCHAEHLIYGTRGDEMIATWDMSRRPINRVVFGLLPVEQDLQLPGSPEEIDRLAGGIETRLLAFLSELQAAGRLLARHDGGQIWVITQEQSMRFCIPLNTCPIETRAKQAAVKSFAKEVLHFGVTVNCASVQLLAEQASKEQWRAARERLKVYAVRFKPPKAPAVAKTLTEFLLHPDLPMSGLVVPIGFGMAEQNI